MEITSSAYASSGASLPQFRDIETGEVFKMYADDLFRMLEGQQYLITAKVIPAGYKKKALRVKK
ncbi:hypothetical protein AB0G00_23760 [Nocardia salmonicida]|uniref:hypothetical protein n=1 Tax=Nocardia salmonicida TaxID=53431 RepID=UPI0033CE20F4